VTDPADPTVRADGAQADILTGKIALSPDAPSATLYHEAAHAWLAVMRRAGKITEADIAKLREAYGPSAADPQWFNEEASPTTSARSARRRTTRGQAARPRSSPPCGGWRGRPREESRRTAASGARQALYESIVYGKSFEGVGDFEPDPRRQVRPRRRLPTRSAERPPPRLERSENAAAVRPTRHRVFEGGSPVAISDPAAFRANDPGKAYRLTGNRRLAICCRRAACAHAPAK
jgi:hypothetical protein